MDRETDGGSAAAAPLKTCGLACSRALKRHTGVDEIGFYPGSRGVFLISGIQLSQRPERAHEFPFNGPRPKLRIIFGFDHDQRFVEQDLLAVHLSEMLPRR
jgi:hypothetical protein